MHCAQKKIASKEWNFAFLQRMLLSTSLGTCGWQGNDRIDTLSPGGVLLGRMLREGMLKTLRGESLPERIRTQLRHLCRQLQVHEAISSAHRTPNTQNSVESSELERTTMPVHDRSRFESLYAGQPRWEIGRPQKAILDVADQITGSILDVGCGSGENALYFAGRGQKVTGLDFLEEPIHLAKQKAVERGLTATFLVMSALVLKELPEVFDSAIDSGLFHVFSDEDRRLYVEGLASVLKPGGRLFLLCFSDDEPGTQGPRHVSQKEIRDTFAHGWQIERIERSHYEVRPDPNDPSFARGGPKAWLVVVRKVGETEK